MPLANRVVCSLLFREESQGMFVCNSCDNKYRSVNGFTNLMTHLRRFHPDYEAEAQVALRADNQLRLRIVDGRTADIFRWVEWVVMERLPFTFCERRLARSNAKMTTLSEKTLVRHMELIHQRVEAQVAAILPSKFGLVLDGCTSGGRHYMAIFAVFNDPSNGGTVRTGSDDNFDDLECLSRRYLLLAFSPVENEEDLSAQSIFDLIADTLSRYDTPWESVCFMVADNCSVNQYIGRRVGAIPMVGCASHRFNLAMKDFLAEEEPLLARIHALMRRLSTIKCRAMLRKSTPLAPVGRNETRWSSVYAMVRRYDQLEPFLRALDHGCVVEHDLESFLLSRRENEKARVLLVDLDHFEGVTKALQKSTLTLSAVRRLFDRVVQTYPALQSRLSPTAAIVNNSALETGIVKLQRTESLNATERSACSVFKVDETERETQQGEEERPSFVRDAFKRRNVQRRAHYVDTAYVPPTSNECERFFPAAKLVFTDLRKRMDPSTLEMVMALSLDRDLWDVYTVESIRQGLPQNERD